MPDTIVTEPSDRASRPIRIFPILAAIGILLSALVVDSAVIVVAVHFLGKDAFVSTPWKVLYFGHTGMLLVALLWIGFLGGWRFRGFGFKAPADRKYVWIAAVFGIFFGVVMTVVDYAHNLGTHMPPQNFSLSVTNVIGLLSFEGLYAGTVEEILFRGLLVTFLMQRMSGRIRLGRFNLHIAGVIVAILFCLSHAASFWTESFSAAAGQQVYAFVWAIIYAYWFEKSGSLLPSIIGHNLGNLIEDTLAFAMASRWS
jgi:uncharacterized protein